MLGREGKSVMYQRQKSAGCLPVLEVDRHPETILHNTPSLPAGHAQTANFPSLGPSGNGDRMSKDVKYLAHLVQPSSWVSMTSSQRLNTVDIPDLGE